MRGFFRERLIIANAYLSGAYWEITAEIGNRNVPSMEKDYDRLSTRVSQLGGGPARRNSFPTGRKKGRTKKKNVISNARIHPPLFLRNDYIAPRSFRWVAAVDF